MRVTRIEILAVFANELSWVHTRHSLHYSLFGHARLHWVFPYVFPSMLWFLFTFHTCHVAITALIRVLFILGFKLVVEITLVIKSQVIVKIDVIDLIYLYIWQIIVLHAIKINILRFSGKNFTFSYQFISLLHISIQFLHSLFHFLFNATFQDLLKFDIIKASLNFVKLLTHFDPIIIISYFLLYLLLIGKDRLREYWWSDRLWRWYTKPTLLSFNSLRNEHVALFLTMFTYAHIPLMNFFCTWNEFV